MHILCCSAVTVSVWYTNISVLSPQNEVDEGVDVNGNDNVENNDDKTSRQLSAGQLSRQASSRSRR